MAAEGPMKELCLEASCSICLDFFRDPVTITECGHNFCRTCLTRSWVGEASIRAPCPLCKRRGLKRNLRPNLQLASFVEIIQKLPRLEGTGVETKGAEGQVGVCEKHQESLKFLCKEDGSLLCVVCCRSQEHKDHEVTPLQEAAKERQTVVAARKENVCQKHQEPLKLFCKNDEAPICVVCDRSKEHRDHKIVPVEEASQEYKDQFCRFVERLRMKRNNIVASKASIMKESQDLLIQTHGERQKTVTKFRELHTFLAEQEELVLARMEEAEKEVARNRDRHLYILSEELSSLDRLIREMEEKCEQPARDLLQDARSTIKRYEEKEAFVNPAAFPLSLKWRIWDFSDLDPLLEAIKKQLKDTLDYGLRLQKASMTLDPDTAHPQLILSDGQKSVRLGEAAQAVPSDSKRFFRSGGVLGSKRFTTGRHFWEVLVGSEEAWSVGVIKMSVKGNGLLIVGKWGGSYKTFAKDHDLPLTVSRELKMIRVCLNCTGGRVAFFDADQAALLCAYSFSGETFLPFFCVNRKGHLKLSS